MMRFGSVCSGIDAASVAWEPLGWRASFFSEIEKFPSAVLAHHYPAVPNLGDMTKFNEWDDYDINVLVGGTPCQSFSVAGLRKGLSDPRGNLMLTFGSIAARYRPKWLVWENVPGVLSSNGGGDFGSFLGMLGELGYGFAYRILDAQYYGVPQRRRRVFVVGYLGDWRHAAAVLFERHSLSGNPAPSRASRKEAAYFIESGFADYRQSRVGSTLKMSGGALGGGSETFVVHETTPTITTNGDCHSGFKDEHGLVIAIAGNTINRSDGNGGNGNGFDESGVSYTLTTADVHCVFADQSIRRLTPVECERLQGFPDNYTQIAWRGKPSNECPDGSRYKVLGNSMAVPVMRWIGARIQQVQALKEVAA